MSGATTTGISTRMTPVSWALVRASSTSEPTTLKLDRRMMERLTPEIACTSVVSVVSRDSTSPTRVVSKNKGSMCTTRRYTAVRRSATTRSPTQVTR